MFVNFLWFQKENGTHLSGISNKTIGLYDKNTHVYYQAHWEVWRYVKIPYIYIYDVMSAMKSLHTLRIFL
jgi:hypothetical protein